MSPSWYTSRESLGMEPVGEAGGYPLPTPPLRLDGERPPIRRPPPRLDEHGAELRAWLADDDERR